ncbi:hypothetical protein [uncultured Aquimarina sp.]|uniref:hypothetical protein n=1 Tax=uncultured Aquimarina sp. TaxID=575652 RepID=UPI002637FE26|nr:hypothetical protein [uncultured Aquimarina sp.]
MKTDEQHIKYAEWKSADELHEITVGWISELKFSKDEQLFLQNLIRNYPATPISEIEVKESKETADRLAKLSEQIDPLLEKIRNHNNELLVLVDSEDQLEEEKEYKQTHRLLSEEVNSYLETYKAHKRIIFELIKSFIKKEKVKRISK